MKHKFKLLGLFSVLVLGIYSMNSCVGLPEGITPVKKFEKERYLGKWYEIARLDHRFERGLSHVTAEYSVREDGGIKVVNRGFKESKGEWSEVEGKAYFVNEPDVGHLKVSFFGPIYSTYAVFELDKNNYQYAFITGHNKKYLWYLSRTPTITAAQKQGFLARAKELGFDADAVIFVDHSKKAH